MWEKPGKIPVKTYLSVNILAFIVNKPNFSVEREVNKIRKLFLT